MKKLTNKSMLYDIVDRCNSLIDDYNKNRDLLDSFRNIEMEVNKTYSKSELEKGAMYKVGVTGIYKISVNKVATGAIQIFSSKVKTKDSFRYELTKNNLSLDKLFLCNNDSLIIKGGDLPDDSVVTIELIENVLQAFVNAVLKPTQFGFETYQSRNEKGKAKGYAGLDENGKVPRSQLPSDIGTGEGGKVDLSNLTEITIGDYTIKQNKLSNYLEIEVSD